MIIRFAEILNRFGWILIGTMPASVLVAWSYFSTQDRPGGFSEFYLIGAIILGTVISARLSLRHIKNAFNHQ